VGVLPIGFQDRRIQPLCHSSALILLHLLARRGRHFGPTSLPAIADLGRFGAAIPLIVNDESQKLYVVVPMAAASRFRLWSNCSISTGLMILGESPYRDRPLTPEFTPEVVQDAMRGSGDPSLNSSRKLWPRFSEAGKTSSLGEISYVLSLSITSFKTLCLVRKLDRLGKCGLVRFLHSQKYSKSWNRNLFLSSHETSGIKYLPFPSISVSDGKTSTGRFYELSSRTLSFSSRSITQAALVGATRIGVSA
jgi:hypothetical protein